MLDELRQISVDITKDMDEFRFYLAAEKIYHYFWHTFADKIIETAKPRLHSEDTNDKKAAQWMLYTILTTSLTLLHPFMPFVTEEVWSNIPKKNLEDVNNLLMVNSWPHSQI